MQAYKMMHRAKEDRAEGLGYSTPSSVIAQMESLLGPLRPMDPCAGPAHAFG
jgi:hypothetical protein